MQKYVDLSEIEAVERVVHHMMKQSPNIHVHYEGDDDRRNFWTVTVE